MLFGKLSLHETPPRPERELQVINVFMLLGTIFSHKHSDHDTDKKTPLNHRYYGESKR
jgi:hypothetical protein